MDTASDRWARPSAARPRLNRRQFLRASAGALATGVLAACGKSSKIQSSTRVPAPTATGREATARAGGSPAVSPSAAASPGASPRASPSAVAAEISLDQFMRISKVVTAFPDLNETDTGQIYLGALARQPNLGPYLKALYEQGGFGGSDAPQSADDLQRAGVYDNTDLAILADTISQYWYSGVYSTSPDQTQTATYIRALAWPTLGYRQTGPTTCGGPFGHWANKPATA